MKALLTQGLLILLFLISACREDPPTPPIVKTSTITDITQTTATGGGQIENDGGKPITSRGVCWGITNQPTINNSKTSDGAGDGSFVSNISELTPNVLYYVRAYASNSVGTGYGDPVSFKTNPVSQAQITTSSITDITANSAMSGGSIVTDGGGEITACGVCWGINHEPTIANNKTTDVLVNNSFTSTINNLEVFTTYYVRAYATNVAGTVYGNEMEFSTSAVPPTVTTSEVTNKSYTSATAGGEVISDGGNPVTDRGICYSTHSNPKVNENNMPSGSGLGSFSVNISDLEPNTVYHVRAYAATTADTTYGADVEFSTLALGIPQVTTDEVLWYGDIVSGAKVGGVVVSNGGSAVTERGICWSSNQGPTVNDKFVTIGSGLGDFNRVIAGYDLWPPTTYYVRAYAKNSVGIAYGNQDSFNVTCSVSISDLTTTNITGTGVALTVMVGLAENVRFELTNTSTGSSQSITASGGSLFVNSTWSASITGLTLGTQHSVIAYADGLCGSTEIGPITFTTLNVPTLITNVPSEITSNSALCGGDISSDGGSTVTERGVCWGSNPNPTTGDNHQTLGSGTGEFSVTIDGLEGGTTYHVRAYAVNDVGTAYGQDETFKTDLASISDIDGNTYKVVQIGNQFWMAENLRTTKYNDNSEIPLVEVNAVWASLSIPAYCWYNNDKITYSSTYGALYNWYTVNTGMLCPLGWHVPSNEEWTTLINFIGGESIAGGKLKSISDWSSPNTGATDEFGFNGLPGGDRYYQDGLFRYLGNSGNFWSSSVFEVDNISYSYDLQYQSAAIYHQGYSIRYGRSVRCLKDN